jgi:protein-disulfide isomerase
MKNLVLALLAISTLTGCGKIIKKVVENNPDIVFSAIKKDPEGFFNTIEATQEQMKEIAQKKAVEKQKEEMEGAFKNPVNPEITDSRALGKKDAPITIVEYADFSCYYCAEASKTIAQVKEAYGDKVRVLFKHFHVLGNPNSVYASQLMEGISKIDVAKAYQFHDTVFQNQSKLKADGAKAYLEKEAGKLVGAAKLPEVIKTANSDEVKKMIESDKQEAGGKFQLRGTPAFNINGVTLRGAEQFDTFKGVIDRLLENKAQN